MAFFVEQLGSASVLLAASERVSVPLEDQCEEEISDEQN